jgi:hypothetical protein
MGARLATGRGMASAKRRLPETVGFPPERPLRAAGPPSSRASGPEPRALPLWRIGAWMIAASRAASATSPPADARSARVRRWPCAPRRPVPSGEGCARLLQRARLQHLVETRAIRSFSQSRSASAPSPWVSSAAERRCPFPPATRTAGGPWRAAPPTRDGRGRGFACRSGRGHGVVAPKPAEHVRERQGFGLGPDGVGDRRDFRQTFGQRPEIEPRAAHDDRARPARAERASRRAASRPRNTPPRRGRDRKAHAARAPPPPVRGARSGRASRHRPAAHRR